MVDGQKIWPWPVTTDTLKFSYGQWSKNLTMAMDSPKWKFCNVDHNFLILCPVAILTMVKDHDINFWPFDHGPDIKPATEYTSSIR